MLYLDTEFTDFNGLLISMGICSSDSPDEFYEVVNFGTQVNPWVHEHVIPFLMKDPIPHYEFEAKLKAYLYKHQKETIVADWPEDIVHLLSYMCAKDGYSWHRDFKFHLIQSGKFESEIPHNAISDARALRDWHLTQLSYNLSAL